MELKGFCRPVAGKPSRGYAAPNPAHLGQNRKKLKWLGAPEGVKRYCTVAIPHAGSLQ